MSQAILTADPDFAVMALNEWRQAVSGADEPLMVAPGLFLVSFSGSFWTLAEAWRQKPPIFVRHIFPVQLTLPLLATTADLDHLRQAVQTEFAALVERELRFSVQSRLLGDLPYKPFDVNNALAEILKETGAPLDVRAPQQVLSVVVAQGVVAQGVVAQGVVAQGVVAQAGQAVMAYLGLSPTVTNLSDWAGGVRRFAREKEQISRSEFKLLEALEQFGIDLPPRGRALDLGAAPGGWTRVLREREQYVTAVDPAALDSRLAQDPNVRHQRMTAETYLNSEPDQFDLIVNDMRLDARDSARLMVAYAPYLYPHGTAIMTLKLPENGRDQIIDHAFNILRQVYTIAGARQLFHNRSEITVYLTR